MTQSSRWAASPATRWWATAASTSTGGRADDPWYGRAGALRYATFGDSTVAGGCRHDRRLPDRDRPARPQSPAHRRRGSSSSPTASRPASTPSTAGAFDPPPTSPSASSAAGLAMGDVDPIAGQAVDRRAALLGAIVASGALLRGSAGARRRRPPAAGKSLRWRRSWLSQHERARMIVAAVRGRDSIVLGSASGRRRGPPDGGTVIGVGSLSNPTAECSTIVADGVHYRPPRPAAGWTAGACGRAITLLSSPPRRGGCRARSSASAIRRGGLSAARPTRRR